MVGFIYYRLSNGKNIAEKAKVGISACLLGYNVRYNGKNKYDGKLVAMLCRHFVLVPFCPEVEAGLGVPRTPIVLQIYMGKSVRYKGHMMSATDWHCLAKSLHP